MPPPSTPLHPKVFLDGYDSLKVGPRHTSLRARDPTTSHSGRVRSGTPQKAPGPKRLRMLAERQTCGPGGPGTGVRARGHAYGCQGHPLRPCRDTKPVFGSVGLGGGEKGDVFLLPTCLLLKFVGMFMVADSWLGASDFT